MNKQNIFIGARAIIGTLSLAFIVWQAWVMYEIGQLSIINYLSYFTNISNIIAAIILIISALYVAKQRKPSVLDDTIRGAAVLYMAVTGVIYATLLAGIDVGLLNPWMNVWLHAFMPLLIFADWAFQPPRSRITWRQAKWWLVFPFGYLVYTLIRGTMTGWYPYPFLNPEIAGGYAGVAAYSVVVLISFFVLSLAILFVGKVCKRHFN